MGRHRELRDPVEATAGSWGVAEARTTSGLGRCIYTEMCEVDDDAIARSELYVDTRAGALGESGEILGAMSRGIIDRTAVRGEFSDLASGLFKRSAPHAITIFKSVGTALEDLVAAELCARNKPKSGAA